MTAAALGLLVGFTLGVTLCLGAHAWSVRRGSPPASSERRASPERRAASPLDNAGITAEAVLEAAPTAVVVTSNDGSQPIVYANPAFERTSGWSRNDVRGHDCRFLQGEQRDQPGRWHIAEAVAAGKPVATRLCNYRRDGESFWNEIHINPVHDGEGRVSHFIGVQVDVTATVENEQRLLRRQREHHALAATAQLAVESLDLDVLLDCAADLTMRVVDAEVIQVLALDEEGRSLELRAARGLADVGAEPVRVPLGEASQAGYTLEVREPVISDDAHTEARFGWAPHLRCQDVRSGVTAVIWDEHRPWGVFGIHARRPGQFDRTDGNFVQSMAFLLGHAVTLTRQTRRVRDNEQLLDAILDATADVILTCDPAGIVRTANAAIRDIFGREPDAAVGLALRELVAPSSRATLDAHLARARSPEIELTGEKTDGTLFPVRIAAVDSEVAGQPLRVVTLRDMTQTKSVEAQLVQAQKMEALGHLTGGVAHDFNNLLTVILANLGTLEEGARDEDERDLALSARQAAERATELTQRLLAFSRRQPLEPKPTDVDALLRSLEPMITRMVGERYEVVLRLDEHVPETAVDPGQLESALMNLVVNARDAMPDGGEIVLETRMVELDELYVADNPGVSPGTYLMVSVTDDGPGIEPELAERVFEPFFTTKEEGRGTGLGLAMVFGFAKQSGGHVRLYSEPGRGTAVKVYLPVRGHEPRAARAEHHEAPPTAARGERILLVEDDELVRRIAARTLEHLGYRVRAAEHAGAALEILEEDRDFELLFTDVVMPGSLSGRDLAERALALRPNLAVLFTSGYSDEAILHNERLEAGIHFLQKPYTRDLLARRLREALGDEQPPLPRAQRAGVERSPDEEGFT